MTFQEIIQKMISKKFTAMLIAVINDIVVLATMGYSPEILAEMITVSASCLGYIFVEGRNDKASIEANANTTTTTITANATASQKQANELVQNVTDTTKKG